MELNPIIFPAPRLTWDHMDYLGELIWIPAKKSEGNLDVFVEKCKEKIVKVRSSLSQGKFSRHHRQSNRREAR